MDEVLIVILLCVALITAVILIRLFVKNLAKYKFIGTLYKYIIPAYLLCLLFSLFANFRPIISNITSTILIDNVPHTIVEPAKAVETSGFMLFATSLFDALKMMAVAFDRSIVTSYYNVGGFYKAFSFGYVAVSVFALLTTSLSAILFFSKSIMAKAINLCRSIFTNKNAYYIFSDSKVANAAIKLGKELKKNKNIVRMYITRASLKTQEGTEYRDLLINNGFDVRTENFSQKMCSMIFESSFSRQFKKILWLFNYPKRNRKVIVYGLFSSDDASVELAANFQKSILEFQSSGSKKKNASKASKYFCEIFNKYSNKSLSSPTDNYPEDSEILSDVEKLSKFKVFVTYQETDFDLTNNFSGSTLHIVNTLSQYDIISSEFVLNNQISNFIELENINDKNNETMHVSFFGLGKINKPIFEKMTYSFQLWGDYINKINYHIFDRNSFEIVQNYLNEYTNIKANETPENFLPKPLLYNITSELNDLDLTNFETLNNYFASIKKDKDAGIKKRFNEDGFEIFVISVSDTSKDIQIALLLRKILLLHFSESELSKTILFVRIGDEIINDAFSKENKKIIVDQKVLNQNGLNELRDEKGNRIILPIVIFGENAVMSNFIENHYETLLNFGTAAFQSYCKTTESKAKIEWLKLNKEGLLGNIATAYSLKTKLRILGYGLNDEYKILTTLDKTKTTSNYVNEINKEISNTQYPRKEGANANPLYLLSELEHNRWLATSYLIYKYSQWSTSEHLETYGYSNPHEYSTKSKNKTRHICMTTNKGLEKLYYLQTKKHKLAEDVEASKKLCFLNDIEAVEKIISVLPKTN